MRREEKLLPLIELFDRKKLKIQYIFHIEYEKKKRRMEEQPLRVQINTPENSESSDVSRDEMKWYSKNSDLLLNWSLQCEKASKAHGKKANKFKRLYTWFGLPSVLIPLTIGILQPYVKEYDLVTSLLMVLSGSFSAVTTFFDFSRKRSKHLEAESKYGELFLKIQSILAVPKKNRNAADVTITECLMTLNSLNAQAPPL